MLGQEAHSVGHQQLHFRFHHGSVLVLEGLTEDLGKLLGSAGWISSEDKGGLLSKESAEELILGGCLLHVVIHQVLLEHFRLTITVLSYRYMYIISCLEINVHCKKSRND